jgi:4-amino-4-deoxy-L-arabinose transferase-like glycosyltransferase
MSVMSRPMRLAWAATGVALLARIAYQIWLSPYEIVADEAQYWDWSRRLAASYYSKGPGIAWLIAASTRVFGVSAWSIRLPAAVASAVASAACARMAADLAPPERAARAALVAALLVTLLPAYQLTAILMTTDAPYIACWAIATWAAWRGFSARADRSWTPWLACGAAIGAGFLFKYTMLLVAPGLVVFALLERRGNERAAAAGLALAFTIAAVCTLPVLVWNARHGAAGLGHLLGYLAAPGGDRPVREALRYDPRWTILFLLSQLAVIGPILGAFTSAATQHGGRSSCAVRFALCCAAPIVLFFLIVTVRGPVEGNWPIAGYVSLLPVTACGIASSDAGAMRRWWSLTIAYGAVALVAIHAPLLTARAPIVGRQVPLVRFRGFEAAAQRLSPTVDRYVRTHGPDALIVAPSHSAAGLLAFYLPGHPRVASAGRFLGDRPSAYDFFDDTDLSAPQARGRPALLLGGTPRLWSEAFALDGIEVVDATFGVYATRRFGGPRTVAP